MRGFISYAHDDHRMFREFRGHLSAVELAFDIEFWADTSIQAGYRWDTTIQQAIDVAELFILLISPAFIASSFIYQHEIPAIRARHLATGALVLPVVLHRCFWAMVCGTLQAVPTQNGALEPIADWHPQRNGYDQARIQIADAIQRHYGLAPKTFGLVVP